MGAPPPANRTTAISIACAECAKQPFEVCFPQRPYFHAERVLQAAAISPGAAMADKQVDDFLAASEAF